MVHWPPRSKRACSAFSEVRDTLNDTRAYTPKVEASRPEEQGQGLAASPPSTFNLAWNHPEPMPSVLLPAEGFIFFPCLGRDPSPLTKSRFQAELSHATVPQNSPSRAVFIAVWDSNGPICLNFHCFCVECTPLPWPVSSGLYWWGVLGGEGTMFKMVAVDRGGCFAYLLFFKASFLRKRKRQRKSFL